jgi:phenylalanyl-tRNA synthetase beta chain
LDPDQKAERRVRRVLAGAGLKEAWTSSFMSSTDPDLLGLAPDHPARNFMPLANPMSEDADVLRTTLLPGLLRSVARNRAQHADGVALFEIARVYEPSSEELPREGLVVGAALTGYRRPPGWTFPAVHWDFFSGKGILESLFASMDVTAPAFAAVSQLPWHPTRAAVMALGDVTVGVLGELHPDVCARFDVDDGTIAFELSLAPLFNALPGRARVEELPRFPAVYMDLAVVVDDNVPARLLDETIGDAGAPELQRARLFDVYRGEQVPRGYKSLAYALELRVPDRTLTDADAVAVRDRILAALKERAGAELRS